MMGNGLVVENGKVEMKKPSGKLKNVQFWDPSAKYWQAVRDTDEGR